MPMDLATMIPRTTRTGDADTIRWRQMLVTGELAVHTATCTSSALPVAVLSLWTVWELGTPMALVTMIPASTRIRDVGTTRSARLLLTTVMAALIQTTSSFVRR